MENLSSKSWWRNHYAEELYDKCAPSGHTKLVGAIGYPFQEKPKPWIKHYNHKQSIYHVPDLDYLRRAVTRRNCDPYFPAESKSRGGELAPVGVRGTIQVKVGTDELGN